MSQIRDQVRDQVREYDTITVTPSTPHIGAEIGKVHSTERTGHEIADFEYSYAAQRSGLIVGHRPPLHDADKPSRTE